MSYHRRLLAELRELRSKHSGPGSEYETICDAIYAIEKIVDAQPEPGTVRVKIAVAVLDGIKAVPGKRIVLCHGVDEIDDWESAMRRTIGSEDYDNMIARGFIEADLPLIQQPPTVPGRPVE